MNPSTWWWQSAISGEETFYLTLLGAAAVLLCVLIRAWVRVHHAPRDPRINAKTPRRQDAKKIRREKDNETKFVGQGLPCRFGALGPRRQGKPCPTLFSWRLSNLASWRLRKTARQTDNQAGTATIEFTLVFPIVLFLILLLVQVTLLMVGNIFVHYAAYAATRSAIVQIPVDDAASDEPVNTILLSTRSPKFTAIRRAAVFAVMPVCANDQPSDTSATISPLVSALNSFYQGYGRKAPNWVGHLAAGRLRYADAHTHITFLRTKVTGGDVTFSTFAPDRRYSFTPREPITVRVTHQFNLAVPYVRVIFADGKLNSGHNGAYTTLRAQYTLTNEGINPALPPLPSLPRVP